MELDLGFMLVLGVISGVICMGIFSMKNHFPVEGFFFGFFLGLIAIILSLFLPTKREDSSRSSGT